MWSVLLVISHTNSHLGPSVVHVLIGWFGHVWHISNEHLLSAGPQAKAEGHPPSEADGIIDAKLIVEVLRGVAWMRLEGLSG